MRAGVAAVWVAATAVLCGSGCPTKETLGAGAISVLSEGVINDPRNKSLRFDILKFGLDRFCFEMTNRGAPLKLQDDNPVLGRFFASSCQSRVVDDRSRKTFVVQFEGHGYAWTNISRRIGFTSAGLVEYAPDFQMHEGAMYVYFRPKNVDSIDFRSQLVESMVARTGAAVFGVDFDAMGRNIVQSQLRRGFTVIRYGSSGETDFGLGYVPIGRKPFKPFQIRSSSRVTLANDRTEIHAGQHDFVGAFRVDDDDQALYLTLMLDGATAVDVLVVSKGVGDLMIDRYAKAAGPTQLTAPPLLDEPLMGGQQYRRYVRVRKGAYYLILDHSAGMGRTTPQLAAGDDRAAKVDYAVQLGDEP